MRIRHMFEAESTGRHHMSTGEDSVMLQAFTWCKVYDAGCLCTVP